MATSTFDIRDGSRAGSARASRTEGECLRYRLDVVAGSAVDVVQSAGGWLFDRVMAGWQVTVHLPQGGDTRPLRILGVAVSHRYSDSHGTGAGHHSLAVSAEAFACDAGVREKVLESLDDRLTEVALWGEGWPLGVDRATTRAQHVLSAAARMFKGHALEAAGIACEPVGLTETLLCDAIAQSDSGLVRLD